jgi:transposase
LPPGIRSILSRTGAVTEPGATHRRFLDAIDAAVPDNLDVHVVLDNSSTHKTDAINTWLLRHPRFHFHFTPTSSSWLNLVERWFAELTNRLLRRSAHRSIKALTDDLNRWIASEMPAWTLAARRPLIALRRLDPPRLPIVRIEQSHLPSHRVGPLALTSVCPDLDGALRALTGLHRRAWIGHQEVLLGFDPPRIPRARPKLTCHLFPRTFG